MEISFQTDRVQVILQYIKLYKKITATKNKKLDASQNQVQQRKPNYPVENNTNMLQDPTFYTSTFGLFSKDAAF